MICLMFFFFVWIRALWDAWLFGSWNTEMFNGWNAPRLWPRSRPVSLSISIRLHQWIFTKHDPEWFFFFFLNWSSSSCSLVFMHVLESWACGVILFTLLAGSPPFWHRKQMLMLRMIMEGRYQFSSPEWDDRSDTVKDLVRLTNWNYNTFSYTLIWILRYSNLWSLTIKCTIILLLRYPGCWWWTQLSVSLLSKL